MPEKIGVFVCDCGSNIAEIIDTAALREAAAGMDDVVEARIHRLWCSEDGRAELVKVIREQGISRVVIAACSPKQHEADFRKALAAAGLNPYLLQIANLREQIAWVTKDKAQATQKALAQLKAAINRVRHQQPLEKIEIECKTDFLVIGAGSAGIMAALTLAQKGRKVYLVEKEPWIGGKVVAFEEVYPNLECAPCMLEPKMDEILHSERIVLMANSEVTNVKGFFGNFQVEVKSSARLVDPQACIGCGACYEACPAWTKNKFDGNLSIRHAIYSAFPGVLPNLPVIDRELCLRYKGKTCAKCQEACPLGAVNYEQQDTVTTIDVGAIVVATGADVLPVAALKDVPAGPDLLDAYQFERIISATGPTGGKVLTAAGEPAKSIAFVQCAGSRDKEHKEYCSSICCATTLKLMHLARKKAGEELKIYDFHSDWCLGAKGSQEFYHRVAGEGVEFILVENPNNLIITRGSGGGFVIKGWGGTIQADMIVMATPLVPKESSKQLAKLLGLSLDKDGFFAPEHGRMAAASTTMRGIYIAGTATGPKDVPSSVLQAQATAGLALGALVPGEKMELEVMTAKVDESRCGGCRVCLPLCPYQAISYDEEKKASRVNEILCKGCGVCVSGCPAGAIVNRHFTQEQIFSEIEGILNE